MENTMGVMPSVLNKICALLVFTLLMNFPALIGAAQGSETPIKVGYASVTGNRIPLWVAHEMGFFSRQGLSSQLIFIATSAQGMPALISGQMPMFSGSPETAAQAVAGGAPLVIIASAPPTPYKLLVQPDVKNVNDLKGKKIGIDRIGGSSYYATRRMMEKLGLKPESVEFLQVAGGGAQRVAAFRSRLISAVVTSLERFERENIPYDSLADAIEMGIRVIGSSYITTRNFHAQNRDAIEKFTKGLIEANHWTKNPTNKRKVLQIYAHYLRNNDPRILELNYRLYVEPLPIYPMTDLADLQANLTDLAESNPKLKKLRIAEFVDNSFIQRLQQNQTK
jgi:ABC-type nitrate/sulfonate/bicarbonate transport system substrate-binding protein